VKENAANVSFFIGISVRTLDHCWLGSSTLQGNKRQELLCKNKGCDQGLSQHRAIALLFNFVPLVSLLL
jgi:hypothetical protein